MQGELKVDLCFQVVGKAVAVDHGFALYGAVSRVFPFLHEDCEVGLKLIRGRYMGMAMLDISPCSELVFRLPSSRLKDYVRLAGKTLEVQGCCLSVGVPRTKALLPAAVLYAPLVTTKNGQDQARFEAELKTQMESLSVKGDLSVGKRRTFGVHGKQLVGYPVRISQLRAEDSLILQTRGLGGRRKMGCGFFETDR